MKTLHRDLRLIYTRQTRLIALYKMFVVVSLYKFQWLMVLKTKNIKPNLIFYIALWSRYPRNLAVT